MAYDIKKIQRIVAPLQRAAEKIPGVNGILSESLGDIYGLNSRDVWRLKMVDPPFTEFRGQFRIEDLTESVGARISDTAALNSQSVDRKYVGGEGEYITFTTRIYASSSVKNVQRSIEMLKGFTRRDASLNRAPIFKFSSGTEVLFTCFVKTVGNIKYDPPRPNDGTIKGATMQVALARVDDIPSALGEELNIGSLIKGGLGVVSSAASSAIESVANFLNIPGASLHKKGRKIITKQGQTFEHLAQIEYSNALYGDVLRRAHYNKPLSQIKPALDIGDVIDLVHDDDIRTIKVTPQSIPLKDATANLENIKDHLELRGKDRIIYV